MMTMYCTVCYVANEIGSECLEIDLLLHDAIVDMHLSISIQELAIKMINFQQEFTLLDFCRFESV